MKSGVYKTSKSVNQQTGQFQHLASFNSTNLEFPVLKFYFSDFKKEKEKVGVFFVKFHHRTVVF